MPDYHGFAQTSLDVEAGRNPSPPPVPRPETAFCVALIGDFGAGSVGRAAGASLARRGGHLVDRDDLDAVLARLAPEVALPLGPGAPPARLRFTELDDFHPDRLFERLPQLAALRETRRRLADPRTFAETVAAVRDPAAAADDRPASSAGATASATAGALAGGSLLDMIVDASPDVAAEPDGDELQAFIRRALRPHLVPDPDPRQAQMLESVDAAIAAELRSVLRHPEFRALESLWRGVDLLVRRLETGSRLRLVLIDLSRDELAADLLAAGDVGDSATAALLRAAAGALPEPAPWAVLTGLYTFDPAHDSPLLDRLARLGATLGAPWISAAGDHLAAAADEPDFDEDEVVECEGGAPSTGEAVSQADPRASLESPPWRALRSAPHARSLALLVPGIVLRQPYGEDEPCDAVRFDELEPGIDADAAAGGLLHGNAALAGALLLAQAFSEGEWEMEPPRHREVERLSLVLHRHGGTVQALPCARHAVSERDAMRLLAGGLMPLVAPRESDGVRLLRWQSVSEPATALAGRWAHAPR